MITFIIVAVAWTAITSTAWLIISTLDKDYKNFMSWLGFFLFPIALVVIGLSNLFKKK
jgi:hypothetical protein